jgi:hypothetical protein
MFTQESENLAKVSNSIGSDIRLALLALDRLESGINEGSDNFSDFREESVEARSRILDVVFKLMEFSANPAGPKPEPVTKA